MTDHEGVCAGFESLGQTVGRLAATLATLEEHMRAVRRAASGGDLAELLDATALVEATSALVAAAETERHRVQQALERSLGTSGLAGLLGKAAELEIDAQCLRAHLDEVHFRVVRLREEERRVTGLLDAAVTSAHRTRAYLERLRGVDAPYGRLRSVPRVKLP